MASDSEVPIDGRVVAPGASELVPEHGMLHALCQNGNLFHITFVP